MKSGLIPCPRAPPAAALQRVLEAPFARTAVGTRSAAASPSARFESPGIKQGPCVSNPHAIHHDSSARAVRLLCSAGKNSSNAITRNEVSMAPDQELQSTTSSEPSIQERPSVSVNAAKTAPPSSSGAAQARPASFSFAAKESLEIQNAWTMIMRWSKRLRKQNGEALEETKKVAVFGGGSFATAMGTTIAANREDVEVVMLLRTPEACIDINEKHENIKYLKGYPLPHNIRATANVEEAILGAQYVIHAVPVQSSRAFLKSIKKVLPPTVPLICVSKGLEIGTGLMMSEVIEKSLGKNHPAVFLSGPSFAKEVMERKPTGMVSACKDYDLNRKVQALFASPTMRVNTTTDVIGVEICGALKNVLAIGAGIVEGLGLGNNSLAAFVVQGCSEIRWLAEKAGAKPTTISGLSGLGDIMLTCYGSLSRNRSVGVRLGQGEKLEDIIASSSQVAEGVATAGAVVSLAKRYRVSLPVLTAVAGVLSKNLQPEEAVESIMNLPQIEES
eukprot:gene32536-17252_t